jgi:hypothetical protein
MQDVGSNSSVDDRCLSPNAACQNGNTQAQSQIAYMYIDVHMRASQRLLPAHGRFRRIYRWEPPVLSCSLECCPSSSQEGILSHANARLGT